MMQVEMRCFDLLTINICHNCLAHFYVTFKVIVLALTLKEPGGRHFLFYLSRLLFFRAETSLLFFSSSLALDLRPFFFKSDPALRNRALGPTKN